MNQGIEDLISSAKRTGAAVGVGGLAAFWYDFAKDATAGTVGNKKTKLILPANTMVESGLLYVRYGPNNAVAGATVGTYAVQLVTANDMMSAIGNPNVGQVQNFNRVFTGAVDREVLINVLGAAGGAQVLGFFRFLPLGA